MVAGAKVLILGLVVCIARASSLQVDAQTQQLLADLAAGNAALQNRIAVPEGRPVAGPAAAPTALVDTRLVAKPTIFSGDAGSMPSWADWSFQIRAYVGAVNPRVLEIMRHAADSPIPVTGRLGTPADVPVSAQLYYILVMLVKGKALDILKGAPEGDGAEAWRLVTKEWEPRERTRFAAMLSSILRAQLPDPLSASMVVFERAVKQYQDQSGNLIDDEVLAATVLGGIQNAKVSEHMQLNASRMVDFEQIKKEIERISQAQKTWDESTTAQSASSNAMEVDAIWKGKGKGKGGKTKEGKSGKGKETKSGKAKGVKGKNGKNPTAYSEQRQCYYCQRQGHLEKDCRQKKRDAESGAKGLTASLLHQPGQGGEQMQTSSSISTASTVPVMGLADPLALQLAQQILRGQPAPGTAASLPAYMPQQPAYMQQQPLRVSSLVPLTLRDAHQADPCEVWPDTYEDYIFMTCDDPRPEQQVCTISSQWLLLDSGSGLTTCPASFCPDIPLQEINYTGKLEAATGTAVKVEGVRRVPLLIGGVPIEVDFKVSNVTRAIMRVDSLLQAGCFVTMSPLGCEVRLPDGTSAQVHRFGKTFWLEVARDTAAAAELVVASREQECPGARGHRAR